MTRVFYDRIVSDEDQLWLYNKMLVSMRQCLKEDIKMVIKGLPYEG